MLVFWSEGAIVYLFFLLLDEYMSDLSLSLLLWACVDVPTTPSPFRLEPAVYQTAQLTAHRKRERDMEKQWPPIVIAMKGHPGTGKSTVARAISASLGLPLLDKDDVYYCAQHLLPSSSVNELSYSVLWQMTETQLQLGLSVVIDSPFSRRARLDKLLELAGGFGARVVIVECRPKDEGEWRRRLEARGKSGGARGHKPATWEEIERLLEEYSGCWDYDVGDVKKIVVDTTAEIDQEKLAEMVLDFIKSAATL